MTLHKGQRVNSELERLHREIRDAAHIMNVASAEFESQNKAALRALVKANGELEMLIAALKTEQ